MRVRILNYGAYGTYGKDVNYAERYPVGSIQEVVNFYPDTGEVELKDGYDCFAPSEYLVVEEGECHGLE